MTDNLKDRSGDPGVSSEVALLSTNLPETRTLRFVSRGKVRDLYEVRDAGGGEAYLLFVATDRISAFDVVLKNGVPGKGALLTQLSVFWFNRLAHVIPNHLVASSLEGMPPGVRAQIAPYWEVEEKGAGAGVGGLKGRTLLVRKAKVVKLEAIVRGYLTGSAWSEYKKSRTVHGIPLPEGLVESSKLPEPLFTPSTKADLGEHDENISPGRAKELIGEELYAHISSASLALFKEASEYALSRGLILADTKFEFGLVPSSSLPPTTTSAISTSPSSPASTQTQTQTQTQARTLTLNSTPHTLILVDEALTPDSSRYWSLASYAPGQPQPSFDKQFLRDWLVSSGFRRGLESGAEGREGAGWEMTQDVVWGTSARYAEVVRMLVA
ncbi:ADE1 [Sanghuangporus vaninii]